MNRLIVAPLALCTLLFVVFGVGSSTAARSSHVSITPAPAFTGAQLSQYAAADWPVTGGDLQNDRYSSLAAITPANVGSLKLAWHIHLGECAAYQAAAPPVAPGIPAICLGPGDIRLAHTTREQVPITDLIACTQVLAITAIRYCGSG